MQFCEKATNHPCLTYTFSYAYILTNKKPEEIADIDHNLGYDESETLYTGGFRDPNTFVFRMRSDSFLSDHRYVCEFSDDYLEIRMSNNTVNPRNMYRRREDAPEIVLKGKKDGSNQ